MSDLPEQAIQTAALAIQSHWRGPKSWPGALVMADKALRALADDGWHLVRTDPDAEPIYRNPDHCKHADPDCLIVQRNNGVRWITCTSCGTDFERIHHDERPDVCRAVLPGDGELPTLTCIEDRPHDVHRDRDGSRWEDTDR